MSGTGTPNFPLLSHTWLKLKPHGLLILTELIPILLQQLELEVSRGSVPEARLGFRFKPSGQKASAPLPEVDVTIVVTYTWKYRQSYHRDLHQQVATNYY